MVSIGPYSNLIVAQSTTSKTLDLTKTAKIFKLHIRINTLQMFTVVTLKESQIFYQVLLMRNKLKLRGLLKSNLTRLKVVWTTRKVKLAKLQNLEVESTKSLLRLEKFINDRQLQTERHQTMPV